MSQPLPLLAAAILTVACSRAPDPIRCTVVAERSDAAANGRSWIRIRIQARDTLGRPVRGAKIVLRASNDALLHQPGPTADDGETVGEIASERAGRTRVRAAVQTETGEIALPDEVLATFRAAGPPLPDPRLRVIP